ncbi:glutathione S-transferase family protein [Cystobacter fuscus]|uniref:glutathione S-transferase family protein n=1 Tax=Cystobacter fuscus TaxID=43 RepID=UPI002B2A64A9|nr:glutathione S-transferase family protein [Cystobacter fuscus]
MKLHHFSWGLYPRRVTLYLAEKAIRSVQLLEVDPTDPKTLTRVRELSPLGTVPVLEAEDSLVIRQSLAILEYLEERFPEPNLLGETPAARAATRELMALIDEANTFFGIWCHKGSPVFAGREPQSAEAAAMAAEEYYKKVRRLDTLMADAPFLTGDKVTIADCMAMALFQFARGFYGVALPADCTKLIGWYERFAKRPSVSTPEYPPELLRLSYGLKTTP